MSFSLGRLRPTLLFVASTALVAGAATVPQAVADSQPQARSAGASKSVTGPRPFKAGSYWNTPLGHAPRDPHSGKWIGDAQTHSGPGLNLVVGDWGMPVYRSKASDPLVRISSGGHTIRVHIPSGAHPMKGGDAALAVIDKSTNQVVGLFGARHSGSSWSVSGMSRYGFQSNGIAGGLRGGSKSNFGHRGLPASVHAVTKAEVKRGRIRHRLEIYWHETASRTPQGRSAYFPMTGGESGKSGVVPEGAVIRIKPSVNLKSLHLSRAAYVVARALQRYGAVVGDNSGQGNSMKLQGNANWSGLLNKNSLRKIPWSDYVFVKGGYRP